MASSIWMKKHISTFNKSCFGFPQTHASKIVLSAWTPFIAPETPFQSPSLFGYSFAHSPLGGRSMACMPPSRSNLKKRAMTHYSCTTYHSMKQLPRNSQFNSFNLMRGCNDLLSTFGSRMSIKYV